LWPLTEQAERGSRPDGPHRRTRTRHRSSTRRRSRSGWKSRPADPPGGRPQSGGGTSIAVPLTGADLDQNSVQRGPTADASGLEPRRSLDGVLVRMRDVALGAMG
jgi:hypothetical protein